MLRHSGQAEKFAMLDIEGARLTSKISLTNCPDRVAQLVEHWASIPKDAGSYLAVAW